MKTAKTTGYEKVKSSRPGNIQDVPADASGKNSKEGDRKSPHRTAKNSLLQKHLFFLFHNYRKNL